MPFYNKESKKDKEAFLYFLRGGGGGSIDGETHPRATAHDTKRIDVQRLFGEAPQRLPTLSKIIHRPANLVHERQQEAANQQGMRREGKPIVSKKTGFHEVREERKQVFK